MENHLNDTLYHYQEQWVALVNKAMENFGSLTAEEKIWYTVQALIQDVDNGGFISHYYNYGADLNEETIESLIALGFPEIADSLRAINALFPNAQPSKDIAERNDVISSWADEKAEFANNLLNQLDEHFYAAEAALEDDLVELIKTKIVIEE